MINEKGPRSVSYSRVSLKTCIRLFLLLWSNFGNRFNAESVLTQKNHPCGSHSNRLVLLRMPYQICIFLMLCKWQYCDFNVHPPTLMKLLFHCSFYDTSIIVILIIEVNLHRPHWSFIAPVVGVNVWLFDEHQTLAVKQNTQIWDIWVVKQVLFDWQCQSILEYCKDSRRPELCFTSVK